jgi:hypothetical protein
MQMLDTEPQNSVAVADFGKNFFGEKRRRSAFIKSSPGWTGGQNPRVYTAAHDNSETVLRVRREMLLLVHGPHIPCCPLSWLP